MKILILGGDGMLGHQLFKFYKKTHEVKVTLRKYCYLENEGHRLFNQDDVFFVDLLNFNIIKNILHEYKPNIVINAAGIIKQRIGTCSDIHFFKINSILPHYLSVICEHLAIRLIHISTDCVFSGEKGNYSENDIPDPIDIYGISKQLGEISNNSLTLRTSLIGLELKYFNSLIEWFLRQKGVISGFSEAYFNGVTTLEMCRIINNIIFNFPDLTGIWHISSEKISKYDLLSRLSQKAFLNKELMKSTSFKIDRTLNGCAFTNLTQHQIPSWDVMLEELSQEILSRGILDAQHI